MTGTPGSTGRDAHVPVGCRGRTSWASRAACVVPLAVSLLLSGTLLLLSSAAAAAERTASPRVLVTTAVGDLELELDEARAPVTVRNFLRYVDAGRYDGGVFHRTVRADNQPDNAAKIAVVQAGVAPDWSEKNFPAIQLEPTSRTGLKHRDGTLSMARAEPNSATSDFFICIGDQPELDEAGRRNRDGRGFAAFGRVVRGMDVVRRINAAPADGQTLRPPIRILKVRRLTPTR